MEGYIAEIKLFGGNFAPRNWAFCDGQLLPISQYTALFSIIGTQYGGDGRTTLGLPDLRGRVAIGNGNGPGLSPHNIGAKGGAEAVVMTTAQMPNHGHNPTMHAERATGDNNVPADRMLGVAAVGNNIYASFNAADDIQMSEHSITETAVGGNQPLSIMQPYQAIPYIICLNGIFPSRS